MIVRKFLIIRQKLKFVIQNVIRNVAIDFLLCYNKVNKHVNDVDCDVKIRNHFNHN